MIIVLRNAGCKKPAFTIENVQYFEPLPGRIQYTVRDCDGVQSIDYGSNDNFEHNGVMYDFCQVYVE